MVPNQKKYIKTTKKNHCKPIHNYYIAKPKFKDPLFNLI